MNKPIFFADDEIDRDVEEAMKELDEADSWFEDRLREMDDNRRYRKKLVKRIESRQIDPLVEKALKLAQNLGHAVGANEALGNKIKHMESRIKVRDEEIERNLDRNEWKSRAEAAEAKLKRIAARKRR